MSLERKRTTRSSVALHHRTFEKHRAVVKQSIDARSANAVRRPAVCKRKRTEHRKGGSWPDCARSREQGEAGWRHALKGGGAGQNGSRAEKTNSLKGEWSDETKFKEKNSCATRLARGRGREGPGQNLGKEDAIQRTWGIDAYRLARTRGEQEDPRNGKAWR